MRDRDVEIVNRAAIARLYNRNPPTSSSSTTDTTVAIKVSLPRPQCPGSKHDRDIYGGRQYAPTARTAGAGLIGKFIGLQSVLFCPLSRKPKQRSTKPRGQAVRQIPICLRRHDTRRRELQVVVAGEARAKPKRSAIPAGIRKCSRAT